MATIMRVRTQWGPPVTGGLTTHYFGPWPGAGSPEDIQSCITRVHNMWLAVQLNIGGAAPWTVQANIDLINDADGSLSGFVSGTSASSNGTAAGEVLPLQTQGLIAWTTSTVADGKRLAGATYVPAPIESDSVSGVPTAAYVTRLGSGVTALLAAGTFRPLVWHRPIINSAGVVTRPGSSGEITGGTGRGTWSVLRSRR